MNLEVTYKISKTLLLIIKKKSFILCFFFKYILKLILKYLNSKLWLLYLKRLTYFNDRFLLVKFVQTDYIFNCYIVFS